MELKEIIALTKNWWWLVLALTVGSWCAAFFSYDHLPVGGTQKVYSSTVQMELPRDPIRIISFRGSSTAKRIYINNALEMAQMQNEQTKLAAARYYTLLDNAMKHAKPGSKQAYGDMLKAFHKQIEESRELLNREFPGAYLKAEDNTTGTLNAEIAMLSAGTLTEKLKPESKGGYFAQLLASEKMASGEDKAASNEDKALYEALMSDEKLNFQKLIESGMQYEIDKEASNQVFTLKVKNVDDERAARMWADALALAGMRESFRRSIKEVENTQTLFKQSLLREVRPPSSEDEAKLVSLADNILNEVEREKQKLRNFASGSASGNERPAFNVTYPSFTRENAKAEKSVFYQRLINRINAEYPSVGSSSLTSTPVGSIEREQLLQANINASTRKRELDALKAKLGEVNRAGVQFEDEHGRWIGYKQAGNPEMYTPNPSIIPSPDVTRTKSEMTKLEQERGKLEQLYWPSHRLLQENQRLMQLAISQYVDAVDAAFRAKQSEFASRRDSVVADIASTQSAFDAANAELAAYKAQVYALSAVSTIYGSANRELELVRADLELSKDYDREIQRILQEQSPVLRVFSFADKPQQSGRVANSMQIASIVAFIVLAGSIMMLYVLTLARNKVTTEFDVRKHINLPVLSKLPRRPDTDRSLLDISPRSAFAEQFSTLATLVRSYAKELSIRSLLVTSAVKEEGKTDIACNLSIALARKGLRVLLIDADFHRSMVSKFFHVNVERGSMNYVESAGATDLANYVTPSPAEGLDLLGAGGSVADPVRLIESERFRQMLKQAEAEYDLVVIDSPPVARVGDALIIASEVDATVFVVSSGDVTFADAALAKRLLTNVQANLLGVILNNSRDTRAREYYNYYYEGTRRRVRRVVD